MLTDDCPVEKTLISGDPELCKAFLFEAAVTCAKNGQHAIYFASKQIETMPVIFHDRKDPSVNALKFMTFVYTPTYNDLAHQLIRLHTFTKLASLIVVDDLDEFAGFPNVKGRSREGHVALVCALIELAALNCSKVLNDRVHVWVASFSEDSYHQVYEMYFKNWWLVTAEPSESGQDKKRRVWLKEKNGGRAFEFHKLDDPVLAMRRFFAMSDADTQSL